MPAHRLRDGMACKQALHRHLLDLRRSGIVEKRTDECNSQPVAKIAPEHLPDPGEDKQKSNQAATIGCDEG
jgi:hypothetical protein